LSTLITHEWLAEAGGSENVFEQIALAFPDADTYCLWNDNQDRFPEPEQTWLARTPLRRSKAAALPFLRAALRSIPVENYSTVIASSHAFGHYNAYRAVQNGARGFAYVHSPARYIWAPDHDVRGQSKAIRAVAPTMRWLDKRTTTDKVQYAANSEFVRQRIRAAWGVDAEVIHPPVAVDEIAASLATEMDEQDATLAASLPENYVLGASRLIGYKRVDQVVELAAGLGKPVVIAGDGPERAALEALAAKLRTPAYFVGRVSDRLLYELYKRAGLFVFLPIEDFGIMPLEAIAAGCPVIVNSLGGAWEGVGQTGAGYAVDSRSMSAILEGAKHALQMKDTAGPSVVSTFSNANFRDAMTRWVDNA
jgi:glycosyltransferase involved in cell wall biosynthesis